MATSELLNAYKRGNGNPQYVPAEEMLADIENDLLDGDDQRSQKSTFADHLRLPSLFREQLCLIGSQTGFEFRDAVNLTKLPGESDCWWVNLH